MGMRALPDVYARLPEGLHTRQSPNAPCYSQYVTHIRLIACTGRSITQANTSVASGYIIHAYLKILTVGQQLVRSGYDERTYPRDITENVGYVSVMF